MSLRAFSLYRFLAVVLAVAACGLANPAAQAQSQPAAAASSAKEDCQPAEQGSSYIPVDSWVYPAVARLNALGYLDDVYIGLRPWTRASLNRILVDAADRIHEIDANTDRDGARQLYSSLISFVQPEPDLPCGERGPETRIESAYSVVRALSGTPLRDSFHLGSTIINDYGRPYQNGINNYTGLSGYATAGRFQIYARGEFEGAPSATGYSQALTAQLAAIDKASYPVATDPKTGLPFLQATIPTGPIATVTKARVLEAYVSAQVLNHVISFGKQDAWYGPGMGSGMAYSNNAENLYTFRVNRIEPLYIPLLSKLTGKFRYDFMVGPLKGHIYPKNPWFHAQKISFKPTQNLEIGFQRSAIWGGQGHTPITLHTFLKSFFSLSAPATKKAYNDPGDPGARFAAFDFSYRVPFLRNWLTIYTDSEVHDDMWSVSAPRRAAWRPGLYLTRVPGLPKLDFRVEAATTDPPVNRSNKGMFIYWEYIQQQGYTSSGQMIGDWIGREGKGGQAWLTYHLSGNEWIQLSARNQKAAKDFIPGGTTLNDINFELVKRFHKDLELRGQFTYERWKAPIYKPGLQTVTSTTFSLRWYPEYKVVF